jgi:PAS domain S-box-containing protein
VTVRDQRDDTVRANEAKLLAILRAIPGVVYVKDRDGRMLMANQGAADLIGKPLEDFIGKTDLEFLEDKAEVVMATDRRIMAGGKKEIVEEVITAPDGRPTVWMSTKTPFFNSEGNVIGLIGSSIDFTEQRAARDILGSGPIKLLAERGLD